MDVYLAAGAAAQFAPASLAASFVVGSIGMGCLVYGKKQLRLPQLTAGFSMLVFPYFVPHPLWMLVLCGLHLGALWAAVRAGW